MSSIVYPILFREMQPAARKFCQDQQNECESPLRTARRHQAKTDLFLAFPCTLFRLFRRSGGGEGSGVLAAAPTPASGEGGGGGPRP